MVSGWRMLTERGDKSPRAGAGLRFVVACVLCLLAPSSFADDAAQANRLMVEAVSFVRAYELEPSAAGKFALLKRAYDNLVEIVERHPTTELAVKLATGQRVGNISMAAVRKTMNSVRPVESRKAGEPVRVWRLGSGVVVVAVRPGGGRAVTVDRNGVAALRDIETGRLLRTWRHPGGLSDADVLRQRWGGSSTAAVSPGGRRMLTAGRDGTVVLSDIETGSPLRKWEHARAAGAVALSRGGRLALVGVGREALLVDVEELKIRRSWRGRSPVTAVAFAPNGRQILAGFADGRALLGEAGTGEIVHRWEHPGSGSGGVRSATFSQDGRSVLTGAANRTAVLRDTSTGKTLHEWQVGYRISSVAISRDGRWVLTGDEGHEVELHDAKSGRTVRKWRYDAPAEAVAFSPAGGRVLMGFADGFAILCEIRTVARRSGYARTILTPAEGCW